MLLLYRKNFLPSHHTSLSFSFSRRFIYLFVFGCTGSLLLHAGFLELQRVGATLAVVHGLLLAVASPAGEHGL